MAEEVKLEDGIENEEAQLKAELDRIKRESQPAPPEEAKAAEPVPTEEKPVEKPVEAKVEPKPTPVTDDDKEARTKGRAFQLLRQREKELEEARAELARRQALENQREQKEPSFDEQPADYLLKEINATKAELARVKAEEQRRDYIDGIKRQEEQFVRQKPDYYKATEYLIDKDIKQWERAGLSRLHTNQVLEAAKSSDPRFAGYKQQISRLQQDPGVIAYADQQGLLPEEAAAYVVARDTWLSTRRDMLAEGAKARGVTIAEVAYEEAVDRGWNGNPQDGGKADAAEQAARARVQQAREVSAATHSLSDSATAEAGPEVRVLKNRQQILDLDDETLDNLIASGKYRELS